MLPFTSSGKYCISNLREAAEKWLWKTQKKTPENWRVVDDDADADAAGNEDDADDTNDIDDSDNRDDDYDVNDDDDDDE